MQVVILAAGKGKRMKELTKKAPKPMLEVKGQPILEYKIRILPKSIDEIVFVVGYCAEHIIRHFKKEFEGKKITYIFQKRLNGTGGALHLAKGVLKDKFLVMMGDDLYHKRDIKKIIKHDLAILAREVDDPSKFGIIKTDKKGHIVNIVEKPKRSKLNLAVTGLYVLNKKFFDYDLVSIGKGEYGLPQTLAVMAKDHKIKVEKATFWHPISCPEDLDKAKEIVHKFSK